MPSTATADDAKQAHAETSRSAPPQVPPPRGEDKPSGGGFIWFLAFLIVAVGGGYAAWPYVGDKVEPYLEPVQPYIAQARDVLGLTPRPTEPGAPFPPVAHAPASQASAPQPPAPQPAPVQPVASSAPTPAVVMDTDAIQALENRLVALETRVAQPVEDTATPLLEAMARRMDALEAQLGTLARVQNAEPVPTTVLDTRVDESALQENLEALKAQIAALNTRLSALERSPRGPVDPTASTQALVLSVSQLKSRAAKNTPFLAELEALARIGGTDPLITAAVDQLRAHAEQGAMDLAGLKAGFKLMAANVMRAHTQSGQEGWWSEMADAVSGLVSVRRTNPDLIDDPVERALAQAEQALAQDDAKSAVIALESLTGGAADAARDWLDAASARIAVDDALETLHNYAVQALAATGGA